MFRIYGLGVRVLGFGLSGCLLGKTIAHKLALEVQVFIRTIPVRVVILELNTPQPEHTRNLLSRPRLSNPQNTPRLVFE